MPPIATAPETRAPNQSRWGHHPCDYATYRKLKRLNHLLEKAKKRAGTRYRWDRKTVHRKGSAPALPLPYELTYTGIGRGFRLDIGYTWVREMYTRARTPVQALEVVPFTTGELAQADALLAKLEAFEK